MREDDEEREQRIRKLLEEVVVNGTYYELEDGNLLMSEKEDADELLDLKGRYFDALKYGKSWLYEKTFKYQPRTGRLLLNGSSLYLFLKGYSYMVQATDRKSRFILINRRSHGDNLYEKDWLKSQAFYGGAIREYSLPNPLIYAYYYRFSGFKAINPSISFGGIEPFFFPSDINEWESIDGYLSSLRLKKKYMPFIEKYFPGKCSRHPNMLTKDNPRVGLMSFLDTRVNKSKKEGDVFFVKTEIQDKVIYHIRDGDVENMRILSNPVEAIDRYCEHVLLGKSEQFDFLPFTSDFISPIDIYPKEVYEISNEEKKWWKNREKNGDWNANKWDKFGNLQGEL